MMLVTTDGGPYKASPPITSPSFFPFPLPYVHDVGHDRDGASSWGGEISAVDISDAVNECLHVGDVVALDGDLRHLWKVVKWW